jgi:hypothetical protein
MFGETFFTAKCKDISSEKEQTYVQKNEHIVVLTFFPSG